MSEEVYLSESSESDSMDLLKKLISRPAPGVLTCPRCNSHAWKLRLEPNKDFFTLECRNCLAQMFVEFCDEGED